MRQYGILLHITSLPSRGGVGALGIEARRFIDHLAASGARIWQMLPVGPTGFGESPYQSGSTMAGNPLLIDCDELVKDGLLDSYEPADTPDGANVDFERARAEKNDYLHKSFAQSWDKEKQAVDAFADAHPWARDYALFAAVKEHFGGCMWKKWPDEGIRLRTPEGLAAYQKKLARETEYQLYCQYLFFLQWKRMKEYAADRNVGLFGDMPIYAAEDSADTWTHPEVFQLDENRAAQRVSGVPPDYFSADGQKWGNPLYDWKGLKKRGYDWWLQRLAGAGELFDLVRIDHFIGFANYYAIPADSPTARVGKWEKGPGRSLFRIVKRALPSLRIIAEDLGEVNARVRRLLKWCGYPGMRVLSFGFDGGDDNPHLPKNYVQNSVVYTGTHDNDTLLGWWQSANETQRARCREVLGIKDESELCPTAVQAVMASAADACVLPMQDILGLGHEARMNTPGTIGGNWLWRMKQDDFSESVQARLNDLCALNGRGAEE